jgi:hypothetical protein
MKEILRRQSQNLFCHITPSSLIDDSACIIVRELWSTNQEFPLVFIQKVNISNFDRKFGYLGWSFGYLIE